VEIRRKYKITKNFKGFLNLEIRWQSRRTNKIINCSSDFYIRCLLLLSNGRVSCGFADGILQIWNIEKNVMVHRLCDHTKPVYGLIELSNRNMASISVKEPTVKVWNLENGQLLNSFELGQLQPWKCFIALPKGRFAVVKIGDDDDDSIISFVSSITGEVVQSLTGHKATVRSLVLLDEFNMGSSSDDHDHDHTIKIWNVEIGR
jgi:WD40 repeat protein